jgi:hypothetical protein
MDSVMPALVAGIHVLLPLRPKNKKDVDGRDNPRRRGVRGSPGHDGGASRSPD